MAIGQGFLSTTFTYINEHKLVRTRHVATIAKGQAHAFCNRQSQLSHFAWTDVTQILWTVFALTLNPNGFAINKIRLLSSLALTRKLHDVRFLSVSPLYASIRTFCHIPSFRSWNAFYSMLGAKYVPPISTSHRINSYTKVSSSYSVPIP